LSHRDDPHLRPLSNRVISSKANLSHEGRTLTHVLLQVRHTRHSVTKGPSHMTSSLGFMRQHTSCHTRTLTWQCLTRTLTCDPYQIRSYPARQRRHTMTLTHFLLQVRNMRHIVARGPSHTTPSLGQSMWRREPERREGGKGTMAGHVKHDSTIHHRTTTRHHLTIQSSNLNQTQPIPPTPPL
jgi:hypothetical protein